MESKKLYSRPKQFIGVLNTLMNTLLTSLTLCLSSKQFIGALNTLLESKAMYWSPLNTLLES